MKKGVEFSQLFISSGVLMLIAFGASILSGYPKDVGDIGVKSFLMGALFGVALFVLMMFIGRYLQRHVSSYYNLIVELRDLFSNLSWATIIVISVMAGVSEELLFRGVIQSYLISISNPGFGIIVSAFLFGIMHFYNRLYIALTLIVGLFIGWLYYDTQSLLLVVVLHSVYDVLAFASIVKYPQLLGLGKPKA